MRYTAIYNCVFFQFDYALTIHVIE